MPREMTGTPLTPRQEQAELNLGVACREMYNAFRETDGDAARFLTYDPQPDDAEPLVAFLVVLPYSPATMEFRDSVSRTASRLFDVSRQWAQLEQQYAASRR